MSALIQRRSHRAQSSIEVILGSLVLITLTLFGLDLSVIVLANTANDSLAKSAARAAANQGSRLQAMDAAKQCVSEFKTSVLIVDVKMSGDFSYEEKRGVLVKTIMTVKVPVSFSGMELVKFEAQAAEPVVASPADV